MGGQSNDIRPLMDKEISRELLQTCVGDDYVITDEDVSIVSRFLEASKVTMTNEALGELVRQMSSYSKPEMKKKFFSAYFGGTSSSSYAEIVARNRKHASIDSKEKVMYLPKPFIDDVITPYVDGLVMWKKFSISRIEDSDWSSAVWENQDASSILYVLARMRTLSTGKNLTISLASNVEATREARIRMLLIVPSLTDNEVKYLKPELKKLYFGDKVTPAAIHALVNTKRRSNDALKPMVEAVAKLLSSRDLISSSLFMTGWDALNKEYRPLMKKQGKGKVRKNSVINPFALNGIRYLRPSEKLSLEALDRNSQWEELQDKYSKTPRTEISDDEFKKYQKAYSEQCRIWFDIRRAARVRFDRMRYALKAKNEPLSLNDAEATLVDSLSRSGVAPELQDYLTTTFRKTYRLGRQYDPLLGSLRQELPSEDEADLE